MSEDLVIFRRRLHDFAGPDGDCAQGSWFTFVTSGLHHHRLCWILLCTEV